MNISKNTFLHLFRFIGIFIFIYILKNSDLRLIGQCFFNVQLWQWGVIAGLLSILSSFRFYRWQIITNSQKIYLKPLTSFFIYYSSLFLGGLTPGRIGEISRIWLMKKENASTARSLASFLLERFLDLGIHVCFLLIGALFYFLFLPLWFTSALLIILAVGTFLFFLTQGALKRMAVGIIHRYFAKRGAYKTPEEIYDYLDKLHPFHLKFPIFLSFAFWIIWAVYYSVFLGFIGIEVPFVFILLCMGVIVIGAQIPISISGVGIREVILISLFGFLGLAKEQALGLAFIMLATHLIFIFLGLIAWLFQTGKHPNVKKMVKDIESSPNFPKGNIPSRAVSWKVGQSPWRIPGEFRNLAIDVFDKRKINVIIPTKNEEEGLRILLPHIEQFSDEIIVVDAHSTDKTVEVAQSFNAKVIFDNGKGKGSALRKAIDFAQRDILVFIDADGSHDPYDIPELTAPILLDKADCVVASRLLGGSAELGGIHFDALFRTFGSDIIMLIINLRFGTALTDSQNGFRAIRRSVAQSLKLKENITTIEQEMTIKVLRSGYSVTEIPSHEYSRWFGDSRIKLSKVWFNYVYTAIKYCLF